MKLILVIFAVMVRVCISYPVIQQNIDDVLFNALLADMAFDVDDFKLQLLQKEDALKMTKDASPQVASTSPHPFPVRNLTNTETTINLTEQHTTSTATVSSASKPDQKKVAMATLIKSTFSVNTANSTETPALDAKLTLLDILTGSTAPTTRSAASAKPVTVQSSTATESSAVTDIGNMTYSRTTTSSHPVTAHTSEHASAGYAKGNMKDLWNKALGIVNDLTTEMSIIGWTNIFTTGVTSDRWHTTHESPASETTPSTVAYNEDPSYSYIDDALSAVDDLSSLLADVLTLNF